MSSLPATDTSRLRSALGEERETAREQLTAAWQLHVSRIEEQLHSGWRDHVERVFEDRFADLAGRIEEEFRAELDLRIAAELKVASPAIRDRARRETSEEFNRAARRLLISGSENDWAAALIDAAGGFTPRGAAIAVDGRRLKLIRAMGADQPESPVEAPLDSAPAFASAISSRDTVVALREAAEISGAVAGLFANTPAERCYLFPITSRDRVVAVLYAEGEGTDVNALETLAALAGAAAGSRQSAAGGTLVAIAPAAERPEAEAPLEWSQLSRENQEHHLRARRFARVRVAELRLYKSQAVRTGRASRTVYRELKDEIDSAREEFRREFLPSTPTMVDYLHFELVRTLANEDVEVLGEDYPGPLA